jgi:hypothetical protein
MSATRLCHGLLPRSNRSSAEVFTANLREKHLRPASARERNLTAQFGRRFPSDVRLLDPANSLLPNWRKKSRRRLEFQGELGRRTARDCSQVSQPGEKVAALTTPAVVVQATTSTFNAGLGSVGVPRVRFGAVRVIENRKVIHFTIPYSPLKPGFPRTVTPNYTQGSGALHPCVFKNAADARWAALNPLTVGSTPKPANLRGNGRRSFGSAAVYHGSRSKRDALVLGCDEQRGCSQVAAGRSGKG